METTRGVGPQVRAQDTGGPRPFWGLWILCARGALKAQGPYGAQSARALQASEGLEPSSGPPLG